MEMEQGKGKGDWTDFLLNTVPQDTLERRVKCPVCKQDLSSPNLDAFKFHVAKNPDTHRALAAEADVLEAFKKLAIESPKSNNTPRSVDQSTGHTRRNTPNIVQHQAVAGDNEKPLSRPRPPSAELSSSRGHKKTRTPPSAASRQKEQPSPATSNRRRGTNPHDFGRAQNAKNPHGRKIWEPEEDSKGSQNPPPKPNNSRQQHGGRSRPSQQPDNPDTVPLFREPESMKIREDQLVKEVKDIYSGLALVENKCIEVDRAQTAYNDSEHALTREQWQALIALHRTLLHEHHDFFLASQHPSANAALRRLGAKYKMPERMWRHGVHSFLELLRTKLPASMEYMLTYIYVAYGMVALLYETVPVYADNWVECLGDLGRYRMAIEDDDIRDREIWAAASRQWYLRAISRMPTTGRLYHHLAILARPNALEQLFYYQKSLCVETIFYKARESIMTLFDPVLASLLPQSTDIDTLFVAIHGMLFSNSLGDSFEPTVRMFLAKLKGTEGTAGAIASQGKEWIRSGYFMGVALGCCVLEFSNESSALVQLTAAHANPGALEETTPVIDVGEEKKFKKALRFFIGTLDAVIERAWDDNALPFLHTALVFLFHVSSSEAAMERIEGEVPWKRIAQMMDIFMKKCEKAKFEPQFHGKEIPPPHKGETQLRLPEDYAMRGLIWSENVYPKKWFGGETQDEEEKYFNLPSMAMVRCERMLWLCKRMAGTSKWLTWDDIKKRFSVASRYDKEVSPVPTGPPDAAQGMGEIVKPMDGGAKRKKLI